MNDSRNCHEHISSIINSYLKELDYRIQHKGVPLGLSTGISALDEILGGMRGGEVILLGARPAMGKTSFAINLSYKIAKSFLDERKNNPNSNKSVLWISIECPRISILQRLIAAKIPDVWAHQLKRYEYGTKSYEEFETIANIGKEISQLPIYICDDFPQTVGEIENKIEEINRYSTIGFVVVDYLQLIDRENISCDEILQELKSIAKDLNVPILILSQLSTALENRRYKMPLLKDIRVFKKLTHIDKILFLYREYYYLYWNKPKRTSKETDEHYNKRFDEWHELCKEQERIAEFYIAKNNIGTTGHIECFCDLDKCKFDDLLPIDRDNL
ncbi:MAG: DnaB-like helicase C-terminal domain-containing protein [Alphaproteobacteria bacterium]|nr:DnaB-like helicase C-terminal domain-containing protein [Alphaproteobacteria bacterium]